MSRSNNGESEVYEGPNMQSYCKTKEHLKIHPALEVTK